MSPPDPRPSPIVAVTRATPGPVEIPGVEVRQLGEPLPDRAEVLELVRGAAVVISMYTDRVDGAFLRAAGPGLRGVCNHAVGVNNIDLDACRFGKTTIFDFARHRRPEHYRRIADQVGATPPA